MKLAVGTRVKIAISTRKQWNIATATILDGLTGTVTEIRQTNYIGFPVELPYLVKLDPHDRGPLPMGHAPVEAFHFQARDLEILETKETP